MCIRDSIGLEALTDVEPCAAAQADEGRFLLCRRDRKRRIAAGFGKGVALGADMGKTEEGRQCKVARPHVITKFAEELHRVRIALRRQRLRQRRDADRTTGVDIVPTIGKAGGGANALARAIACLFYQSRCV